MRYRVLKSKLHSSLAASPRDCEHRDLVCLPDIVMPKHLQSSILTGRNLKDTSTERLRRRGTRCLVRARRYRNRYTTAGNICAGTGKSQNPHRFLTVHSINKKVVERSIGGNANFFGGSRGKNYGKAKRRKNAQGIGSCRVQARRRLRSHYFFYYFLKAERRVGLCWRDARRFGSPCCRGLQTSCASLSAL